MMMTTNTELLERIRKTTDKGEEDYLRLYRQVNDETLSVNERRYLASSLTYLGVKLAFLTNETEERFVARMQERIALRADIHAVAP